MRLFLSSFMMGNRPERLVSLAGEGARVAVILNAFDYAADARAQWLTAQADALRDLGFVPTELDLRDFFGASKALEVALGGVEMLWVSGGNSFLLRRAMLQSGFDSVAGGLLACDRLVYAGFSAAVCCAAPTLRGIELVDNPHEIADKYARETPWEGLGLIDYAVAVHYQSPHFESALIDKLVSYYQEHDMPYVPLRDGEVIVVDGNQSEVVR